MPRFSIDGVPGTDVIEASSWDEASAKVAALGGSIWGEIVEEGEWKSARRDTRLTEIKFAADSDKSMAFSGYGAVFGNVDSYGDVIAPGAFAKSLAQHKASNSMPLMLLSHDPYSLPIGVWTSMSEDGHGLKVEGRLLDTTAGLDTYKALKAGALNGLSIGFRTIEYAMRSQPEDPKRTLKVLDLQEVSIVTMPANGKARVTGIKSADQIKTTRDFETFLRDAGGFSNARAKAIASHGFKAIDAGRDDGDGLSELASALRRNASILNP
jgi:uncharacterized protein